MLKVSTTNISVLVERLFKSIYVWFNIIEDHNVVVGLSLHTILLGRIWKGGGLRLMSKSKSNSKGMEKKKSKSKK